MRESTKVGYFVGFIGLLSVGAALAKEPEQTARSALSTPAGCTDSARGRTHILRFCGEEHYWIKRPAGPSRWDASGAAWQGATTGVSQGPAQNWGGFQRY